MRPRLLVPLLQLTSAVLIAACAERSDAELKQEFDMFVASRTTCEMTADCTRVVPGCPLGCSVAVRHEHVNAVRDKAIELVREFESTGRSCVIECPFIQVVECNMGACTVREL